MQYRYQLIIISGGLPPHSKKKKNISVTKNVSHHLELHLFRLTKKNNKNAINSVI